MDFKANMIIFLLIAIFMVSIGAAAASVTITSVAISPSSPATSDDLQCKFTLEGNESSYLADVIWMKDGQDYINEAAISVKDNVEEVITLDSSETSSGDKWKCRVETEGKTKTSSQVTVSSGDRLVISDISASCSPSCDDDDLDEAKANNGDAGTIKDVKPGATLTLRLRVENEWPSNTEDHEITDNYIECTLEDIGDTDEIDDDADFEDLDPGEHSEREELEFDISKDAEHRETYTIKCSLEGYDNDGIRYSKDFDVDLEVKKDQHDVEFTSATLNPSTISCDREFQAYYKVKNLGYKDEDDVQVVIRNSALSIFSNDIITDLQEGPYDDEDTEYSKTRSFTVDDSVKAGTYTIQLEAVYDNGDEHAYQELPLIVQDCAPATTTPTQTEQTSSGTQQEEQKEEVEVVQQPVVTPTQTTGQATAKPVTTATAQQEETSFTESVWFVALLAVVIVILLGILAMLIVFLFKK